MTKADEAINSRQTFTNQVPLTNWSTQITNNLNKKLFHLSEIKLQPTKLQNDNNIYKTDRGRAATCIYAVDIVLCLFTKARKLI